MALHIPYKVSDGQNQTLEPAIMVRADDLGLKNGSNANNSAGNTFWTAFGRNPNLSGWRGFYTNTTWTANTYKTIASYTGKGAVANIIGPSIATGTTIDIRLTLDTSRVYLISLAGTESTVRRALIGTSFAGLPSATNGDNVGAGNQQDTGFADVAERTITSPDIALSLGNVLTFNSSMTLEMRCSVAPGSSLMGWAAGVSILINRGLELQ